jgi:hypothetical protein
LILILTQTDGGLRYLPSADNRAAQLYADFSLSLSASALAPHILPLEWQNISY